MATDAPAGLTVLDAFRRLERVELQLNSDITQVPKMRTFSKECECCWECGAGIPLLLGGVSTVIGGILSVGGAIATRSFSINPQFLGLLGHGLILDLVAVAVIGVHEVLDKRAKARKAQKLQEELQCVQALKCTLAFEGNDRVAVDIDDGILLTYLQDLSKFSLRQLYTVYKRFPERLYAAADHKRLSPEKMLPFIKLEQFLKLATDELVEALSDTDNDALFIDAPPLLEWLIQGLSEEVVGDERVSALLQVKIARNFSENLSSSSLKEALEWVRKGNTIEELKKKWSDVALEEVTFIMGGKPLSVNRETLICHSEVFKDMLAEAPGNVLEDDGTYDALDALFRHIEGKKPLEITLANWKMLLETADKYHFSGILQLIESFCQNNVPQIAATSTLPELALYAHTRGRRFFLEKIDKLHLEQLQKKNDVSHEALLAEFRICRSHHMKESAAWLTSKFEQDVTTRLSQPPGEKFAETLADLLSYWEMVSETAHAILLGRLVDAFTQCVRKEETGKKERLLAKAWKISCTRNIELFKNIILRFCQDPANKYYCQIAWPKLPDEIRGSLA